jgi:hypothetical protein
MAPMIIPAVETSRKTREELDNVIAKTAKMQKRIVRRPYFSHRLRPSNVTTRQSDYK